MVRDRRNRQMGRRGLAVQGLYEALLDRERHRCARPDPRVMYVLHDGQGWCTTPGMVCEHESVPPRQTVLLDALEAGEPARVQGRDLRGRDLPEVRLRREQAFDWFEVNSKDIVTLAGPTT